MLFIHLFFGVARGLIYPFPDKLLIIVMVIFQPGYAVAQIIN